MPFGRFIPVAPLTPNTSLTGKTAIVTGASSGIGKETARHLLTMHISTLILMHALHVVIPTYAKD